MWHVPTSSLCWCKAPHCWWVLPGVGLVGLPGISIGQASSVGSTGGPHCTYFTLVPSVSPQRLRALHKLPVTLRPSSPAPYITQNNPQYPF